MGTSIVTCVGSPLTVTALQWQPDQIGQYRVTKQVYQYRDTLASEVWVQTPTGWPEQRERYLKDIGGVSSTPLSITDRPFLTEHL